MRNLANLGRGLKLAATFAFVATTLAAPARAHDYVAGDLKIEHPWARASAGPARAGAAYLGIENAGTAADRLLGAETPVAAHAEVHEHLMEGGIMRMRRVEGGVALPPGGTVRLAPGGYHVMLLGLKAPLKEGERFPMTLRFEKAGTVAIEVLVEGVAAMHGGAGHKQ